MMISKEKFDRLFGKLKRNWRSILLLWLPAGLVVLVLGIVFFSVALSEDASFHICSKQLSACIGEKTGFSKVLGCSYQTAWCDVKVIWDKANGKMIVSDLPGLPPVDEKADKELFEKLTSDEFLEKRFEEFQQEKKKLNANSLSEKENLKEYMEELRAERIQFEKEMTEKRKKMLEERATDVSEENNLSGQTEK